MRALLSRTVGGPETLTLEEVPDPVPGEGQVRLRVRACGVNYPDALFIRDLYQVKWPRPFSPGGEVCGVVEELGDGVSCLAVGDLVVGRCGIGGMAERVVLPAVSCTRVPPDTPVEAAAGFLLTYATAYHGLVDCAQLTAGETLLVLGAAGGVGAAAIDLGRALGARVVAAASTEEKAEFARRVGAQEAWVYPAAIGDPETAKAASAGFKALVGPGGADVVYDPVGGELAEPAFRSIAWRGRYLVIGFAGGPIPALPLNLPLLKGASLVGVFWGDFAKREPQANAAMMKQLAQWYGQGQIKPVINNTMPMAELKAAYARMGSRAVKGKLVMVN